MDVRNGTPRPMSGANDDRLREAVRQFIFDNEVEVRQLVKDVIAAMPELVELDEVQHTAKLERTLKRMVQAEIAASPAAARAASPARSLALFQPRSTEAPLPAARVHSTAGGNYIQPPATVLGEPLEAYLQRDPHPLPTTSDREGYHAERHFDYWLSGIEDYVKVHDALARHGRKIAAPFALLDFGCASGRVLRHFACQVRDLDVWGTDLNERHVLWLLEHLPPNVKTFQCTTLPWLPLAETSFDLVTAFSVFTHIDEFELAWLLELRRILRPGGFAYITAHTEDTWRMVAPGMTVYEDLYKARDHIPGFKIRPELFQNPMPDEKTVFRWHSADLNNTNVFLSKRHIRDVWGRFFEVLEILPKASGYQDVVLLRKPL